MRAIAQQITIGPQKQPRFIIGLAAHSGGTQSIQWGARNYLHINHDNLVSTAQTSATINGLPDEKGDDTEITFEPKSQRTT